MSNFLPDLANWALRGGTGNSTNNNQTAADTTHNETVENSTLVTQPMTPQELRAQRLARMEELSLQQRQHQQEEEAAVSVPMDIDPSSTSTAAPIEAGTSRSVTSSSTTMKKTPPISSTSQQQQQQSVKASSSSLRTLKKAKNGEDMTVRSANITSKSSSTSSPAIKVSTSKQRSPTQNVNTIQRKKELLLQKCLQIQLIAAHGDDSSSTNTSPTNSSGGSTATAPKFVMVDTGGSTEISIATIAEIIALRLSMDVEGSNTASGQQVIAYLGSCYNRTMEEIRTVGAPNTVAVTTTASMENSPDNSTNTEIYDLLQEMKHQIVSYTTTCMVEPDVFPNMSHHMTQQMAHAILASICGPTAGSSSISTTGNEALYSNITLGGTTTSFYTKIMEELQQQDATMFTKTVHAIVEYYCTLLLLDTDSILNIITIPAIKKAGTTTVSTSITSCTPTNIVTAFTTMCLLHKGVAIVMSEYQHFILPPMPSISASTIGSTGGGAITTATASTVPNSTRPSFVTAANNSGTNSNSQNSGMNPLLQLLSGNLLQSGGNQRLRQPWVERSGVSIEMGTIFGVCLRFGIPKPPQSSNPAFPTTTETLRQSLHSIDAVTRTQRQQLLLHQNECYNFIMSLLKVKSPMVKDKVMTWFTDVLLVNFGASALRPDMTKVSSTNLLCNASMMLLKLCQPFVNQDDKQHLIDAQFLYHPSLPHQGVFATSGENIVARLGGSTHDDEGEDVTMIDATRNEYKPKNAFIPFCFFFCAHALHLSIVPALRQNEILVRRINYLHHEVSSRSGGNMDALQNDRRFAYLIAQQRSEDVSVYQDEYIDMVLQFVNFSAKVMFDWMTAPDNKKVVTNIPEEFVSDACDIALTVVMLKPKALAGHTFKSMFQLFVKLLSPEYATMVRNYNLRAQLGDVLHDIFLPHPVGSRHHRDVPTSISIDPMAGGQTYLLSDTSAQETLAPSLLLLYGEVEHTGYYDKMSHRAKIASLIKYLWESAEHRPAFRRITQNKVSFIKFANGIMNETNTLIATVMQKLPEIREAQEKMNHTADWSRLSEDEQSQITSRLEDNERDVKSSLPLCNKTLQMFGYLNTDTDIRSLFLLPELCSRLVTMLLHVLTKLVGSKGLELRVDNPEQYDFRPKEMLRDLCAIFALFASSTIFQDECAKSGCDPNLLRSAVRTCRRLHLLEGLSMEALASLPDCVDTSKQQVAKDEAILMHAPDEFLDEIMSTYMYDPVVLPSGHYVDRATITQHLLNDPTDPFNRKPLTIDDVQPALELKERMQQWLQEQKEQEKLRNNNTST
jgi:ubiquitin conjugation factor E4 B